MKLNLGILLIDLIFTQNWNMSLKDRPKRIKINDIYIICILDFSLSVLPIAWNEFILF